MSRKSRTLIGSVALLALGAILLGGTQYAMHKTSGTEFCTSCHSMSWATAEWHGSDHFSNATGVQTGCADCHLPPGGFEYVKAKVVTGLRDVWGVAGYVHGASGKRYVLVAIANHPNAAAVRPAIEALVDWTARER